jgi:ferritin
MSKANDIFTKIKDEIQPTTEIVTPPELEQAKTAEDISMSMGSALSAQMNREIYSSLLYYAMGAYFGKLNLEGIESWFYKAAAEEMNHARKFNEYVLDREGSSNFGSVETPTFMPGSATALFEQVLSHEKTVTANIKNLFEMARSIGDYQTEEFLHWYLKEQVEEEKKASVIVDQFKQFGDTGVALAIMDERLGK